MKQILKLILISSFIYSQIFSSSTDLLLGCSYYCGKCCLSSDSYNQNKPQSTTTTIETKKDFNEININTFINQTKQLKEFLENTCNLPKDLTPIISDYYFEDWILYDAFEFPLSVSGIKFGENSLTISLEENNNISDNILKEIANFFCRYINQIDLYISQGDIISLGMSDANHYDFELDRYSTEKLKVYDALKITKKSDNSIQTIDFYQNLRCFDFRNHHLFILLNSCEHKTKLLVYCNKNYIIGSGYFWQVSITKHFEERNLDKKPDSSLMQRG